MDDKRRRISEKAYYNWELEGRPAGREQDHWLKAESEVVQDKAEQGAAEHQVSPVSVAKAAKKTTKKKTTKRAVKKRAK